GEGEAETPVEPAKVGITELVIKGLKKLTTVDAHGNALTAVPDVTGCAKLTTLTLNDNLITDISGATADADSDKEKEQTVLTTINLANNKLTDISKLEKLTSLTSLDLSGNEITDITAIGKLTGLKTLNLNNNKELLKLTAIMDNFPTTTSLDLSVVGTKVASDEVTIKELQKKFSTMKITYKEDTEKK
ncbi:MAG: leucine-rich repeat domain-containing protein, partial [Clostridia bacterium]|nr:leucine-rich repeat domain-containing protein [Clostridia bacterium]